MGRLTDIADAVWTYSTRTLDALSPPTSDGTRLDDIGYAVWTYGTRTVDAGGTTLTVAAIMMAMDQFGGGTICAQ
jgi:hypothetical protein